MATQVIYAPVETGELCARCHDSINFIQPRPDIPVRARDTMTALQRADLVFRWAQLLIAEGQKKGLSLNAEQNELKLSEQTLGDAKVKWHTFNLDDARKQADNAYLKSNKVKEELRKKLLSD
jgi:hypothetical protein